MQKWQNTHQAINYGEIEDCYTAYIPLKNDTKKTTKKGKKQATQKDTKIQEEVNIEEKIAQDLFSYFCQSIDNASDEIMKRKYRKITDLIVESLKKLIRKQGGRNIQMNMTYNQEVSVFYYFIQVDRANQESVSEFYKYLLLSSNMLELLSKNEIWNENDKKEKTSTEVSHFDQVILEQNELVEEEGIQKSNKALEQISQILNFILTQTSKQYESQNVIQTFTSIFLLENVYNISVEHLNDLMKLIKEEIQFSNQGRPQSKQIVVVLPSSEQMIVNYQMNGLLSKKFVFANPKKMFINLLLEMIKIQNMPLLKKEFYFMLIEKFQTFFISYQTALQQLKTIYFVYITENLGSTTINCLFNAFKNKKQDSLQFKHYYNERANLILGIQKLQTFIKELKKSEHKLDILESKTKIFNIIFYYNAQQFFKFINEQMDDNIIKWVIGVFKKHCDNNAIIDEQPIQQVKGKDRFSRLVQTTTTQSRSQTQTIINSFIINQIANCYKNIDANFGEYMCQNVGKFEKIVNPDIQEEYHKYLNDNRGSLVGLDFTKEQYQKLKKMGLEIKAQDIINNLGFQKNKKQFQEQFYKCIGELKILGLIEDTKKLQPTFHKTFFAKSYYQNYADD